MNHSRILARLKLVFWFVAVASVSPIGAGAESWAARHEPRQPRSGSAVVVTVTADPQSKPVRLALEYQLVEPGRYVALGSPALNRGWQRLSPSSEAGASGEFRFLVPAETQKHRRLIRYRIVDTVSGQRLFPGTNDAVPAAAWFVYDGIPAWKGAINPKGTEMERAPAVFSAEEMRRVQAYHLISDRKSVEDATWFKPTSFGDEEARKGYRWTGTLVSDDGTVYDGVGFRPRGGVWRYAMGKNMWKFDFQPGHKFQARDDHSRPYRAKWSKLNLGACIQQGDTGLRGEQGLLESVNFRLFNLAGVPAPRTHWVQLRIIDDAEETPADQFQGDFWGLYLATENVDGNFLREHELSAQSLFKVENFQPRFGHDAQDGVGEPAAGAFMRALFQRRADAAWWRANVDLPRYYSYRAVLEAVHHYDIGGGKNYFLRRDPAAGRWAVVPWDTDLTWSDRGFGDGNEPFQAAGALRVPALRREYQNRLREVLDLLYNADQTGALIDECAAVVSGPKGRLGITEADRRHWDNHPVVHALGDFAGKTRPGTFYQGSPNAGFRGMVAVMKRYLVRRREQLATRLLAGQPVPPKPSIAAEGPLRAGQPSLRFRVADETVTGSNFVVSWRLGAVTLTNAPGFNPRAPRRYEIEPVWSASGGLTAAVPAAGLQVGTSYRARARLTDADGNAGHWSDPVEFTFTE